jgi:hypothetical protein
MNNDFNNSTYQAQASSPFAAPQKPNYGKGFGITSLVLGIVAVLSVCCCCCFYFISLLLGVAAIVFAILARKQLGKFSGLALTGLILGIIAIVLFIAIFAFDLWLSTFDPAELEQFFIETFGEEAYKEFFDAYMKDAGLLAP